MLIHRRTLLSVAAIWLFINTSIAATEERDEQQHVVRVVRDQQQPPSVTSIDAVAFTNALSEYYENIVDQVMSTLTEEITLSAPHSYMSIHHYGSIRRGRCRTSLRSFVHDLRDHLNLMRANLLASIRPLVESNLPSVLPQQQTSDITVIGAGLTEDILALNRHIGLQLGLILNVEEAADIIISQSMPTSVLLLEDVAHQQDSTVTAARWTNRHDQLVLLAKKSRNTMSNEDDEAEALRWLDSLRQQQQDMEERPESRALTHWLRSWLSEVEEILRVQFDERVQDATQLILEDFLVDDSY
ncbi:hypothetical protein BJV82DRAFT_712194 [Fennellomyces sp. T-0311]|nr:hypothetical protein BJV82DRAFT_712194 [Fennellomyces sp. T-0311]